jgi:hypothetical protein
MAVDQLISNVPIFQGTECSLSFLKESTSGLSPETDESSPRPCTSFPNDTLKYYPPISAQFSQVVVFLQMLQAYEFLTFHIPVSKPFGL